MVPCRVLHRAVVFRGVVSLSSVDYVYVLAGAQGEHKVGRAFWEGEAINNQYTQLGTCILGPILSAAHTRSPISIVSAKCRLQDSCNSARCAQHAHAHTTRVSQLQDASMLLWAFKWGFGSDFVYAFAKANACCVELKIAQIARQTTTRRRARVCVYALAIQRWQHNPRMKISH